MREKIQTLEEAAENYYDIIAEKSSLYGRDEYIAYSQGVQDGVKFQQEKMYSEEEVFSIIDKAFHMYASSHRYDAKEWFNQNKKK